MDRDSVKEYFCNDESWKQGGKTILTDYLCYDNLLKVINNRIIIEYFADWVRVALNREAGERPALSRSCNVESTSIRHWETGKARETRKQSQKNCPIGTLYRPCERQEGTIIFMCFVCLFAGEQEGFFVCFLWCAFLVLYLTMHQSY